MTVKHIVRGSTPLRDHHLATDADGTVTLVSYGVPVARLAPSGDVTVPHGWESASRSVSIHRAGVLRRSKQALLAAQEYSQSWLTVADIPLPAVWLAKYGPDSPEPYTP